MLTTLYSSVAFLFFFQAEDGIRDADVTGVQTCALPISEKHSAPSNAITPPSTQATKVSPGRPSRAATIPGVRKIPEPIVIPTTIASPSPRRSERLRSVMRAGGECAPKTKGAQQAAPLTTLTPGSLPNAVGPLAQ